MNAVDLSDVERDEDARLKREVPLVPPDSIASRALVVVIAIMTFLACLTAGGALLVADASRSWRSDIARQVTIEIKPRAGENTEAILAKAAEVAARTPGVIDAHALSKSESDAMLEPWLGQGVDLSQLPIPQLVIVNMAAPQAAQLDLLRDSLAKEVPQASLDDHRIWLSRLDTMADVIVAFASALFVLMIVALGTAIGFATRGAMAGTREVIEVLHFVGATDAYIATQFQTHFLRLGLRGALVGGSTAALLFAIASLLSIWWRHSAGGEEISALFGAFALGAVGYIGIAIICAGIASLTGLLSRSIVFNHLRQVL